MSDATTANDVAIGFRVKSGWAVAVLLAGPVKSPRALDRLAVALSDAEVPESRQPYHAGMGVLDEDSARIQERTAVVQRVAQQSVSALLRGLRAAGHVAGMAGVVVGSMAEPDAIRNSHVRAHALEGRLFRKVLCEALETNGLTCSIVRERDVYTQAAGILKSSPAEIKRVVAELGRSLPGPWRAEEKCAAVGAWLALASRAVADG
jgi:hypothetical protein